MAEKCNVCESRLDVSNPAFIRCVNFDCTEVLKCHCCDEKLGKEIAHVKCFKCKQMHCQYCEKDSFFYDVKHKERNICLTCKEEWDSNDPDAIFSGFEVEEFLQDLPCNIELENGDTCEGTLSQLSTGWGCLVCGREADEEEMSGWRASDSWHESSYDRYEV